MHSYRKFDNPSSSSTDKEPMLDKETPNLQPTAASILNMSSVKAPKRELKSWSTLKILTKLQLGLAISMLFFESISHGVILTSPYSYFHSTCVLGTGIWVGVLAVITAGLGLGAFRSAYGNKCLMVGHFVMCIICTVADGILIVFSSICLAILPYPLSRSYSGNDADSMEPKYNKTRGLIANESFLLLSAVIHFIITIVATGFICRNWCRDREPTVAVVYFPGAADRKEAKSCRVEVPSGAKVIFLSTDPAKQDSDPPSYESMKEK